ncbi:MAG: CRISPR-associated protein Cas4 [Thermomicrobiales bacterium]
MEPPPEALPWSDSDLIAISALEHWSYCPRQCALIHLEQTYDENLYTLRGNRAHEAADASAHADVRGVRTVRAMPIWSHRLGLTGRADIVEFHGETPYPVEYKAGARRTWQHEAVQLCAQAVCLEEMLEVPVPAGAIWYHASRTRREVACDDALRAVVERMVHEVRAMLAGLSLPPAPNDSRCPKCSLFEACLPALTASPARLRGIMAELYHPAPEPLP